MRLGRNSERYRNRVCRLEGSHENIAGDVVESLNSLEENNYSNLKPRELRSSLGFKLDGGSKEMFLRMDRMASKGPCLKKFDEFCVGEKITEMTGHIRKAFGVIYFGSLCLIHIEVVAWCFLGRKLSNMKQLKRETERVDDKHPNYRKVVSIVIDGL